MSDTKASTDSVNVRITTIKLNGSSDYLLWAQAVKVYINAEGKLPYLTTHPPDENSRDYHGWMRENDTLLVWLWNNMEPSIAANVMFHTTAKGVWDDLMESYSQHKNMSRVYELYEKIFNFKQGDKSLGEYYSALKGMWEELNLYQPITTDLERLKTQRSEFQVAKFLSGLNADLQPVKSQLLAGERVPSMNEAFCRIQRIVPPSSTSSKDNSAFVAGSGGRGRGGFSNRGRGFGGNRSRGGGRNGQSSDRDSRQCIHCGKFGHIVDTCWAKHGKPEWAQRSVIANTAMSEGSARNVSYSDMNPSLPPGGSSSESTARDDMVAQLIKRVQQLEASNFSSTATLARTGNMALSLLCLLTPLGSLTRGLLVI
ncbi:hypothetical protein EUGRSUZ_G01582 [Eucalyptus grandis]|uniref:Uncharacterized protein n=2 Tax=Eucalyptus grandis TaxID=71139 RepID=A0ACC3K3D5_EUCGR|nr:hypothetical protein EUGRSUZ_G01582 [Eucalyptus grandis]